MFFINLPGITIFVGRVSTSINKLKPQFQLIQHFEQKKPLDLKTIGFFISLIFFYPLVVLYM